MSYTISKVDVWAADIGNRPGTLADVLEGLSEAGVSLEFMIARKVNARTSRVFVAPIRGAKQQKAASKAGLKKAKGLHSLRIEGPDKAGLGAKVTRAMGDAGVNLRGASGAAIGKRVVIYLAVETAKQHTKAAAVARKLLGKKR